MQELINIFPPDKAGRPWIKGRRKKKEEFKVLEKEQRKKKRLGTSSAEPCLGCVSEADTWPLQSYRVISVSTEEERGNSDDINSRVKPTS